ncbi:hypothetical protein CAEBREN_03237 [Caenorhabditis brenneri]|uniref:POU-specific atypical domain-containing protein n=1 Tax=Caenorhabditis brenneri TaxID=135651 RepID=G0NF02_CAEBE|nr:hypothetical protein CAEBREN_03237 [Caenorhabditis brenneri]
MDPVVQQYLTANLVTDGIDKKELLTRLNTIKEDLSNQFGLCAPNYNLGTPTINYSGMAFGNFLNSYPLDHSLSRIISMPPPLLMTQREPLVYLPLDRNPSIQIGPSPLEKIASMTPEVSTASVIFPEFTYFFDDSGRRRRRKNTKEIDLPSRFQQIISSFPPTAAKRIEPVVDYSVRNIYAEVYQQEEAEPVLGNPLEKIASLAQSSSNAIHQTINLVRCYTPAFPDFMHHQEVYEKYNPEPKHQKETSRKKLNLNFLDPTGLTEALSEILGKDPDQLKAKISKFMVENHISRAQVGEMSETHHHYITRFLAGNYQRVLPDCKRNFALWYLNCIRNPDILKEYMSSAKRTLRRHQAFSNEQVEVMEKEFLKIKEGSLKIHARNIARKLNEKVPETTKSIKMSTKFVLNWLRRRKDKMPENMTIDFQD